MLFGLCDTNNVEHRVPADLVYIKKMGTSSQLLLYQLFLWTAIFTDDYFLVFSPLLFKNIFPSVLNISYARYAHDSPTENMIVYDIACQ